MVTSQGVAAAQGIWEHHTSMGTQQADVTRFVGETWQIPIQFRISLRLLSKIKQAYEVGEETKQVAEKLSNIDS